MDSPATLIICIPLHSSGGKFKDNAELRYALRSLHRHMLDPFRVVIVGERIPAWLTGVEHLPAKGLKNALGIAAKAFPRGFLWWYDDCCLLVDSPAALLKVTTCRKHFSTAKTGWAKQLDSVRKRLEAEGIKAWDYSRPHGPYWFTRDMVEEGFADWPGMKGKLPWETWILSKRDWPRRFAVTAQYYGAFTLPPAVNMQLLNYNDDGNTPELRQWLENRFPDPCRFEKPVEVGVPRNDGSVEVHTLRYGSAWWIKTCGATLDAWCARHNYPLRVWRPEELSPGYPCEKFGVLDMLRAFVTGGADWMFFCDADIWVHPAMGPFPPLEGRQGFFVRGDRAPKVVKGFAKWARKVMGASLRGLRGWEYRNTGAWWCSRDAAVKLLKIASPPYVRRVQEQHQLNWWLYLLSRGGMTVGSLPREWNTMTGEQDNRAPAAFYHLCGEDKHLKFRALREGGFVESGESSGDALSDPLLTPALGHPWSMDLLHIRLLREATTLCSGNIPSSRIAVEIGSFQGASTAALVDAVNAELFGELHIVEIKPTMHLEEVLGRCKFPERIVRHTRPIWEVAIPGADFVFIDGCHRAGAFADALFALSAGAEVICVHDSNAPMNRHLWGASSIGRMFRQMPNRECWEDKEVRQGMRTHRGFLVSVSPGVDLSPLDDALRALDLGNS